MLDIVKIALHGKVFNKEVEPYIKKVLDFLLAADAELRISNLSINSFIDTFPECEKCSSFDKITSSMT